MRYLDFDWSSNNLDILKAIQPYNLTNLHPYNLTTLQPYNLTTLQPYNLTTLLPDHQEKKCQWKKRSMSSALLHVLAGDSVLLCLVYTIVLSYMIVAYYIIIWYINYRALIALIFLYNCNVMAFLPQILKTLSLSQCISLFASSIYRCWSFLQYALGQWVKQWSIANISLVSACVIVFIIM